MQKVSEEHRFGLITDPRKLVTFSEERGLWYETPEEIEQWLEWHSGKEDLLSWVRRAMARRLTKREYLCVALHFFHGVSYQHAGQMLGVNPSSVCRAIRRSLRKLRAAAQRQRIQPRRYCKPRTD
ncbi:MAG: sigma-70 family RNA polymerase sigma factor [Candidatus Hydrogenedentes bacterium]|nr:sigma-70 family RNA polymerase sigma factor [Candidatus Hydrogenedentota bacterium]